MRSILTVVVLAVTVAWMAQQGEYVGLETVRSAEVSVALIDADGSDVERSAAAEFTAEELSVLVDGVEVVATSLTDRSSAESPTPWQFLVYIDSALSSKRLVGRSATALGARAEQLVEMGTVEVVVADPIPRRVLAPTRDLSLVDAALSGLALSPPAADALLALRTQLRSSTAEATASADLAAELMRREIETVRRQQDRLLSWLVTRAAPASRRALFLVSGGFDLRPAAFYGTGLESGEAPDGARLRTDYTAVTRAIAGYGWLTAIWQRPGPDPLPRRWGLRRQLLVRLDGNWDPERAESELELGESLIRQEKWKRAESALEKSVFAFYDQPKLRDRQAYALSRLGFALEQQGRTTEAHEVYRKAIELAPGMSEVIGTAVAGLLDPLAPLAALAEATSGGIVRDADGLDELLEGLRYRSRLTFQLAGSTESGLHRLEISPRSGSRRLLAPQWVRSATPEAVSSARARRLLDEELEEAVDGEQVLSTDRRSLFCGIESAVPETVVEIDMVPRLSDDWDGVASAYRVTVAIPVEGSVRVAHRSRAGGTWSPGQGWRFVDRFAADPEQPYLALVVEEMNTGRWFGSLLECDDAS